MSGTGQTAHSAVIANVPGNAQATIISSLAGSVLLFCGLLVAGVFAFASSESFREVLWWTKIAAGVVLILGLISGILALTAVMNGHNLSRRAERRSFGEIVSDDEIRAARKLATKFSEAAFWVAVLDVVATLVMVIGVAFHFGIEERSVRVEFDIDSTSLSLRHKLDVKSPNQSDCSIFVERGNLKVKIDYKSSCD